MGVEYGNRKKGRSAATIMIALSCVTLATGCAFIFETPDRVETIEARQLEMMSAVDSLVARVAANEELLRQLRAQSGSSAAELLENLSVLATELELALQDLRNDASSVLVVQDTTASDPEASTLYDEAFRQYQRRDYVASSEGFMEIVERFPASQYADDALYYLGMSHESDGQPHMAIEEYLGLYYRYPDSERAPAALYRAAMIYGYHNAITDRDRLLRMVMEEYPGSEEAELAAERIE